MSDAVADGRAPQRERSTSEAVLLLWAGLGFAALLAVLFGDLLFGDALQIPSHAQGDAARYFVYQRLFGYAELRSGNLPLWNPHTFSGGPFVGVFQSAIFYPPNLAYLVLPLRAGLCLEMVLHLLLLALFVFVWLRGKLFRPPSAFVAAVVVIFGASCSLRVLAGQLSVIDTYAWWPLLLCSVDRLARRSSLGWILAGILATTMMILAGHPPTVLMAGLATALYCIPALVRSRQRLPLVGGLLLIVVAPLFLSAVQLWTGLQTASEGVRGAGMSFEFATSHSFPPEQLLTLLAPGAFGDASRFNLTYFGRVFYWDATHFMGIIALLFAVHGATNRRGRDRGVALVLAGVLCLAAMGGYTPVYEFFYRWVPGFSFIRAPSKFMFFSAVFGSVLVAGGVDRLLSETTGIARTTTIGLAVLLFLSGMTLWTWLAQPDASTLSSPFGLLGSLPGQRDFQAEGGVVEWRSMMLHSFAIATLTAAVALSLLWLSRRRRWGVGLLVIAAVIELLVFARVNRGSTRMTIELDLRPTEVEAYRVSGGSRVLETAAPSNIAMARRNFAIWGYDPVVLGRYIRFMALTQGVDYSRLKNPTLLQTTRFHPLYSMLRGRLQVGSKPRKTVEHPNPLPRFLLLANYRVEPDDDSVLAAMLEPEFDPRRTVILETEPSPTPRPGLSPEVNGRVRLLDQSTDHIDLEVNLEDAAILVITDAYSRGWRALPLPDSSQSGYQLLPANYVLRAIPLAAGSHRLRVEYSPLAFRAGVWSSLIAGGFFMAAMVCWASRSALGLGRSRFVSGRDRSGRGRCRRSAS